MKKAKESKTITPLQNRFCDIVVLMELTGKVNKRKAYELAGYRCRGETARVEAERTLQIPHVRAYLARARACVKKKLTKTQDDIIAQLERLGFSELTDFGSWDKDGFKLKASKQIPKDKIAALKSITVDEQLYTNKKGKKNVHRRTKIELHGSKGALDSLAKIAGMMKPDVEDVVSFAEALHAASTQEKDK